MSDKADNEGGTQPPVIDKAVVKEALKELLDEVPGFKAWRSAPPRGNSSKDSTPPKATPDPKSSGGSTGNHQAL